MDRIKKIMLSLCAIMLTQAAQAAISLPNITLGMQNASTPQQFSQGVQILILLTILTLAPSIVIMTTGFVRIVIVLALKYQGVTTKIYEGLITSQDGLVYGLTSALFANVLNNIPMSVLFSSILQEGATFKAVFGAIIGSNIGAILTPVGALAGIMWSNILKRSEIKYSYLDFMKYGFIIGVPTLVVASLLIF